MASAFSLAHLTVIALSPPEVVRVASRTGYKTVGLRLIRVNEETPGYPLMHDRKLMTATKAASDDTGLKVLDIEFVRISPDINIADLEPFIAAGAELKAKYIITAPYDPDPGCLADRLAAVEDLAAPWTSYRAGVLPLDRRAQLRRSVDCCRSDRSARYRHPRGHVAFQSLEQLGRAARAFAEGAVALCACR